MSKGTQVYSVRIPIGLRAKCSEAIARRSLSSNLPPLTFTDFVCQALEAHLNHLDRSRRTKARRREQVLGQAAQVEQPEGGCGSGI